MASSGVKLRARWDFAGEQSDDLPMRKGEVITLVARHDSGWWRGRNAEGREGNFPSNYVKELPPPLPARRAPGGDDEAGVGADASAKSSGSGSGSGGGKEADAGSGDRSPRRSSVRLRSSLRCKSLAVSAATRKPVPHEDGRLRTFYLIELTTDTGKKSFMKRYHEVCNLHMQMKAFFPDLEYPVDLRAPKLNANKRQIDVIGARKHAIEAYLVSLLAEPNAVSLMLGWLVPGEKLKVGVDTPKAGGAAGKVDSGAGFGAAPAPAATPKSYPPAAAARMVAAAGFQPGTQCEFSLDSLDAFDDLIMKHYSVIDRSGSPSGDKPEIGQMVEVAYTAMVWDGATTRATEFMNMSSHVFQLGDRSLVPVPPGLHAALSELQPGQSATVVLDPDAGFADVGMPPLVPELAHLVYKLRFVAATGSPDSSVTSRPAADRSAGGKRRLKVAGTASGGGGGRRGGRAQSIEQRFSEHVGDIPTRASFAPHVGRIKPAGVKMDAAAASPRLSAVPEGGRASGGSRSGAGAGGDAGAGGGTRHVRAGSSPILARATSEPGGGGAHKRRPSAGPPPRVSARSSSTGSPMGGRADLMGELGRQVAARASRRDYSHLADGSAVAGERSSSRSPAAVPAPRHTGTMTLDEVLAARAAGQVEDEGRLEMLLSPDEFVRVFGMPAAQFHELPEFRRRALKIKAKLHVAGSKKSRRHR